MPKVEPFDVEDSTHSANEQPSFFKKNKKVILIVGGVFLVAVIVLAIVLPIVLIKKDDKSGTAPVVADTTKVDTTMSTTTTTQQPEKDNTKSRVDCAPWDLEKKISEEECLAFGHCKYRPVPQPAGYSIPACFVDMDKVKTKINKRSNTALGVRIDLETTITGTNSSSNHFFRVDFEFLDNFSLRFKINSVTGEYEVPIPVNKPNTPVLEANAMYALEIREDNFSFGIKRKSTNTTLWDTSLGPLIFEKLNRVVVTKLPSTFIYGMGENLHKSFKHDLNYQNWPVFARDQIAGEVPYANLYGSQPFYTCMEEDGNSHGVVLVNSNAFEYEFIPEPALIYRVTGGVLDFYMFLGPEPGKVVEQFTQYFGRTFMPPYWGLGFQVSRYGYENLDDMKQVLDRFQKNNIPLDTQVVDIDHYDERKDFTYDPVNWAGLPEYFNYLHDIGMRTVMILDPALVVNQTDYWPYDTGLENNVFITWPDNIESPDFNDTNSSIMLGYCWPTGKVAYPDFFKSSTKKWWMNSIARHSGTLRFDGLWIDMNEPAAFGTNEERPFNWPEEDTPYWSLKCPDDEYELVKTKASYLYKKGNKLSEKTLCMNAVQGENNEYKHFDVHSLYGYMESKATFEASRMVTESRGYVISRSTFLGSGQYGGHWTGDNHSKWTHLRYSIIGMLEFNLFGIPYIGADICGFFDNTTEELCARWSSVGAFYPFSRNHNSEKNQPQDPGSMGQDVINSARRALNIRYDILPYYYTLFYKAHLSGSTVVRPLFHEFPSDKNTYGIDTQFLVGPAFLVTPVLDEGVTDVTGYFPQAIWYSYYDGSPIDSKGKLLTLKAPIDFIPLHIRGGHIIPTQKVDRTTEFSRKNPLELIVAQDDDGNASGELYYDDGFSQDFAKRFYFAKFTFKNNRLSSVVESKTYTPQFKLKGLRVFLKPNLTMNARSTFSDLVSNQVIIHDLDLDLTANIDIDLSSFFLPATTKTTEQTTTTASTTTNSPTTTTQVETTTTTIAKEPYASSEYEQSMSPTDDLDQNTELATDDQKFTKAF